jgi:signal transduction histidine kinase
MNLSLRARVMVGAALWSVGLFVVAGVLMNAIMLHYPRTPYLLHAMFGHGVMSGGVALACMLAGFWQVRKGLESLAELRSRLGDIRGGRQGRIDGEYPEEVQPLVAELNALLEHHERAVNRGVAKAGDLAHGLKTPLAVLSREADRARADGHHDTADTIGEQIERMRRQVDYHLAQARAAASGATLGARTAVVASADGLSRTMARLHAGRGMAITVNVAPDHVVRTQREDLDEMLGNLLDNACKWASSRVTLASSLNGAGIIITVDDDGPGLDASLRDAVLRRGVRADQAAPGSGLGLAIVRDLAELYGGSIGLIASPIGGLRARLQLPRADDRND